MIQFFGKKFEENKYIFIDIEINKAVDTDASYLSLLSSRRLEFIFFEFWILLSPVYNLR